VATTFCFPQGWLTLIDPNFSNGFWATYGNGAAQILQGLH